MWPIRFGCVNASFSLSHAKMDWSVGTNLPALFHLEFFSFIIIKCSVNRAWKKEIRISSYFEWAATAKITYEMNEKNTQRRNNYSDASRFFERDDHENGASIER